MGQTLFDQAMESVVPGGPPTVESIVRKVLDEHRVHWEPGSWRCSCGAGAWTNTEHWNGHHASLIADALHRAGMPMLRPELQPDPGVTDAGKSHAHGSDTERRAALEIAPRSGTQRLAVLEEIVAAGATGRTDDELQEALTMGGNTERPRRVELVEGGWIVDSGHRRAPLGSLPAIVWTATPKALAWRAGR